MKTLRNFDFKNKRVLVRCDFNVPLDERGQISDDFRIRQTIPTIEYLIEKGAKVILMSHLGDPEGKIVENLRLTPVQEKLMEHLDRTPYTNRPTSITKLNDCVGKEIEDEVNQMKSGEVLLLENLRFHKEEEEAGEGFARELAKLGDIYINDAFGASHRSHASIVGIPKYLPSGMGFLLEKEIKILSKIKDSPWRPLVVIIGGAKISTKIKLIEQFLERADHLILGGEIANTVLIGKGVSLGKGLLKEKDIMKKIEKINLTNPKLHMPVDGIISLEKLDEEYFREGAIGSVKREEKVFDIGPETIKIFSKIIKTAKMIFWNGPLGMFENKKYENGTKEIAQNIVRNYSAYKVVGGGETVPALKKFNLLERFDHVSTGGGAMLEFLAGEELPGLEVLK